MKTRIKFIIILVTITFIFNSCQKDDTTGQAPISTQKVNLFIKDVMSDIYLWSKQIPDIDYRYETDSKAYFKKLVFKEDKWSYITDDVQALQNSLRGKEKSFGWSLAFGRFRSTNKIFALVEFVHPNTPADQAGLERGDIIFEINSGEITEANYSNLLYAENININFGKYNTETNNIENVQSAQLTAADLDLNPVLFSKIIEEGEHKIGYFLYAQFIDDYISNLDTLIQNFIIEGVTDVIIDLRYNPGGSLYAAQYLCSALAPVTNVDNGDVLVRLQWNDAWQDRYQQNAIMNNLERRFINSVPFKMGLDKIYILTGNGTASASELAIIGLMPYMEVVTVGDTTYGKYTASQTFKPEDVYEDEDYYGDFNNWGLQPIVARYKNSVNFTDFILGLYPTILVQDDIAASIPLGDTNDPVISAAIEDITGASLLAKKSAIVNPYKIFDRGFSRFDQNKRELIIGK